MVTWWRWSLPNPHYYGIFHLIPFTLVPILKLSTCIVTFWNSETRFFSCFSNPHHHDAANVRLVKFSQLHRNLLKPFLASEILNVARIPLMAGFGSLLVRLSFETVKVHKVSFWNLFFFICTILNFDHRELIFSWMLKKLTYTLTNCS